MDESWEIEFRSLSFLYHVEFIRKEKNIFMNKQESDILNNLLVEPFINQRILSETSGHSLGVVNKCIKNLMKEEYLDDYVRPTERAREEFRNKAPQNAII